MYLVELFDGKSLMYKYLRKYELTAQSDIRRWEQQKDGHIGRYAFIEEKL